jgi:hypothetical protein
MKRRLFLTALVLAVLALATCGVLIDIGRRLRPAVH